MFGNLLEEDFQIKSNKFSEIKNLKYSTKETDIK